MDSQHSQLINSVFLILLVTSHVHTSPIRDRDIAINSMMNNNLDSTSRPTVEHLVEDIVEDIVISKQDGENTVQNENEAGNFESSADSKMTGVFPDTSPVVEEIVIRKHEDEEIVPSEEQVPQEPALRRDVDEMFVEPMAEEYVLVPIDDFMELAESGLVFRPKFRYSSKSRRRLGRTTRRRSGRSTAS